MTYIRDAGLHSGDHFHQYLKWYLHQGIQTSVFALQSKEPLGQIGHFSQNCPLSSLWWVNFKSQWNNALFSKTQGSKFKIQTSVSPRSGQPQICSATCRSIRPRICLLILPIRCLLFTMSISATQFGFPVSTFNLSQLRQCSYSYIVLPFPPADAPTENNQHCQSLTFMITLSAWPLLHPTPSLSSVFLGPSVMFFHTKWTSVR